MKKSNIDKILILNYNANMNEKELRDKIYEKVSQSGFQQKPSIVCSALDENLKSNESTKLTKVAPYTDLVYSMCSSLKGIRVYGNKKPIKIEEQNFKEIESILSSPYSIFSFRPNAELSAGENKIQMVSNLRYSSTGGDSKEIRKVKQFIDPDYCYNWASGSYKPSFTGFGTISYNTGYGTVYEENYVKTPFDQEIKSLEENLQTKDDPSLRIKLGQLIEINKCFLKSISQIIDTRGSNERYGIKGWQKSSL